MSPRSRTCAVFFVLAVAATACSVRPSAVGPVSDARHLSSLSASYDAAVLALSPYAYYRLDETSGTVATDSSGNGRNATYQGTSGTHYLLGQTSIVAGLAHSLKTFGANPGYPKVAIPSVNLASNGSAWVSDFFVAAWAKPDSSQLSQATAVTEINDYYLGQGGANGSATTNAYMGGYPVANWWGSQTTFADGNAHLLTMTVHRNASGTCDLYLYVDGSAVQSATGTTCTGHSLIVVGTNAGIGGRVSFSGGAGPYFGEIGGVAIFSSALDARHALALWTGYLAR